MAGGQGAAPPVQKMNFNPRWTRMNTDKKRGFPTAGEPHSDLSSSVFICVHLGLKKL